MSIEDCTSLTQELVFSVSRCTRQGEVTHATLPNVPARNCGAVGKEAMIVQLGKDHVPVRGKCGEFGPRIIDTGGPTTQGETVEDRRQVLQAAAVMLNVIHIAGRDDTTATARVVGSTIRCTNVKDGFLGDPGEFRRGHCALREAASDRQGGSEADPSVQTNACRRKEGLMQATHRVREAAALLHGVNQGKLECVEKFLKVRGDAKERKLVTGGILANQGVRIENLRSSRNATDICSVKRAEWHVQRPWRAGRAEPAHNGCFNGFKRFFKHGKRSPATSGLGEVNLLSKIERGGEEAHQALHV